MTDRERPEGFWQSLRSTLESSEDSGGAVVNIIDGALNGVGVLLEATDAEKLLRDPSTQPTEQFFPYDQEVADQYKFFDPTQLSLHFKPDTK